MDRSNFCGVDDIGVIIPYKKLENLLNIAQNSAIIENRLLQCEKQLGALNGLYSELLAVVGEIRENL